MVFSNRRIDLPGATLAVGLTLFSGLAFAAEQRSADDIIMALKPRVTRGLTTSPADAARAADETRCIAQSTYPFAVDRGARPDRIDCQLETENRS